MHLTSLNVDVLLYLIRFVHTGDRFNLVLSGNLKGFENVNKGIDLNKRVTRCEAALGLRRDSICESEIRITGSCEYSRKFFERERARVDEGFLENSCKLVALFFRDRIPRACPKLTELHLACSELRVREMSEMDVHLMKKLRRGFQRLGHFDVDCRIYDTSWLVIQQILTWLKECVHLTGPRTGSIRQLPSHLIALDIALEQLSSKQSEVQQTVQPCHSPDVHEMEKVTRVVCHPEYDESEAEFVEEEQLVKIKEKQTPELPSLDVAVAQLKESTSSSQLIDDLPVDPEVTAEKRVKSGYSSPVSVKDENSKESVGADVKGDGPHTTQVTVRFQSSEAVAGEMSGQEVECACKICQSVEYAHCQCKQDETYETELVVPVRCTCGHETLLTELLVSAICPCGQEHTEESSEYALGLKVVDTLNQYGNSTECYCGQYAYEDEDEFFECCECECEHHECPETVDQHPERNECEETLEEEDTQERLSVCSCDHHEDEEEMHENFGQVECTGATECACEHPDCFQQCEQLCQHAGCLCEHYEALQHSEECFQENDRQCEHHDWAESELEESSLASRRKSSALSVKFLLRVKKHCKCRTESAGVNLSSSSCTKKHSSIQRVVHSFAISKYSSLNADKDVAKKVTK